jgi:hypothetical protein
MERMGPEALMVLGRTAVPSETAEYLRLEYGSDDLRVAAGLSALRDDVARAVAADGVGWKARARAWLGRGRRAACRPTEAAPVWAIPALLRSPPGRAP